MGFHHLCIEIVDKEGFVVFRVVSEQGRSESFTVPKIDCIFVSSDLVENINKIVAFAERIVDGY